MPEVITPNFLCLAYPSTPANLSHCHLSLDAFQHSGGGLANRAQVSHCVFYVQRYGQSSQFKRTVLEFIVEEMLGARSAEPGSATSCPITIGATPLLTSPSDSPLEFLYQQLNFSESDVIDRQQISLGLQRLGAPPFSKFCTMLFVYLTHIIQFSCSCRFSFIDSTLGGVNHTASGYFHSSSWYAEAD